MNNPYYANHDQIKTQITLPTVLKGMGTKSATITLAISALASLIGAGVLSSLPILAPQILDVWGIAIPGGIALSMLTFVFACLAKREWESIGEIQLDPQAVSCRMRGVLGWRIWTEPLRNYESLRFWSQVRGSKTQYTIYLVTLWHADSRYRITLWESTYRDQSRAMWEAYAALFGKRAIEGLPPPAPKPAPQAKAKPKPKPKPKRKRKV